MDELKEFKNKGKVFEINDDVYFLENGNKYWGVVVEVKEITVMCTFGTDEPMEFEKKYLKLSK